MKVFIHFHSILYFTRRSRTSLVDNFFNRFRMASRSLRQLDNYFQPFQDGFEKFLDRQTSRQLPKIIPRCARPRLKKSIKYNSYIENLKKSMKHDLHVYVEKIRPARALL
jgi:hypothetical protein